MHGNRIVYVVKPSNTNGSAVLHYLGKLRRTSDNRVIIGNRSLNSPRIGVSRIQRRINVIFRRFGLFGGVDIVSGVALTPGLIRGRASRRTHRRTVTLLGAIKLTRGTSIVPHSLSNNRGRHITVTQSLTVHPGIVLFSRTASTLSPRVINSILRIVHRLTRSNVAVILIARRVNFTHRITAHIVFASTNIVRRRNAPSRVFGRPGDRQLGAFLSGIL